MSKHSKQERNRRQLLAEALRYTTLGVFAVAGGSFLVKRHRLVREGKCLHGGICRGCAVLEGCSLPQALSAREILAEGKDDGTK